VKSTLFLGILTQHALDVKGLDPVYAEQGMANRLQAAHRGEESTSIRQPIACLCFLLHFGEIQAQVL
jgi:hypothetical protein